MARCEYHRRRGQNYRAQHNSAENKNYRRDYRERQRAENAALFEADRPYQAIEGDKHAVHYEIGGQLCAVKAAEYRAWNVDYHRAEAGEATYLLKRFDKLVLVFVFKAVLAFCGEYDIRYHNDDDENKAVEIEPFHLF
jgi:hypothetical protein